MEFLLFGNSRISEIQSVGLEFMGLESGLYRTQIAAWICCSLIFKRHISVPKYKPSSHRNGAGLSLQSVTCPILALELLVVFMVRCFHCQYMQSFPLLCTHSCADIVLSGITSPHTCLNSFSSTTDQLNRRMIITLRLRSRPCTHEPRPASRRLADVLEVSAPRCLRMSRMNSARRSASPYPDLGVQRRLLSSRIVGVLALTSRPGIFLKRL